MRLFIIVVSVENQDQNIDNQKRKFIQASNLESVQSRGTCSAYLHRMVRPTCALQFERKKEKIMAKKTQCGLL